ncbi:MAG: mechanosensitive ion channel family protein [Candidatus Cardinium sp.]|nr:mechanosensitive ion channel family protein [Candidatus Cardinium sp.]
MKKMPFIFLFIFIGSMVLPIRGKATVASIRKLNLPSPYDTVHTPPLLLGNAYSEKKANALSMNRSVSAALSKKITKDLKQLLLISQTNIQKICCYFSPKAVFEKKIGMFTIGQYLLLIIMVTLIWLTHKLTPYLFHNLLHRFIGDLSRKYSVTERIFFTYIVLYYFEAILFIFPLKAIIEIFSNPVLTTTRSLILTYLLYVVVNIIQEWIQLTKRHNKFIIYTLPLFSVVAKVIILFVGLITLISKLGFETEKLTHVLTYCTLGLSFAAKDPIQNLFSSFLIMMDKPFVIGDEIIACAIRGNVEKIGLRATLLRTREGSVVYIPNGKLADSQIDNLGRRTSRIIPLVIPVSYAISLEQLTNFIEGLHKIAKYQPFINLNKTSAYIDSMQEQGLMIHFNIHLDSKQTRLEQECRNKTILLIVQLARQLHIQLGKNPH